MCLILLPTLRDHFSTPLVYISHARILGSSHSALESNVAILKGSEERLIKPPPGRWMGRRSQSLCLDIHALKASSSLLLGSHILSTREHVRPL